MGTEGVFTDAPYQSTYSPVATDQYRLNLELFVDTGRKIGAMPILLTQASLITPTTSPEDRQRIGYAYPALTHEALVRAMDDCNRIMREVGSEKDVPVLDLARMFTGQSSLFEDHVHTSSRGSVEIAGAVAEFLTGLLDN